MSFYMKGYRNHSFPSEIVMDLKKHFKWYFIDEYILKVSCKIVFPLLLAVLQPRHVKLMIAIYRLIN